MNGDGLDDVVVKGSFPDDPAERPGTAYVIYGRTSSVSATVPIEGFTEESGFRIEGEGIPSFYLDSADVNGDDRTDLLIRPRFGTFLIDPEDPPMPRKVCLMCHDLSSFWGVRKVGTWLISISWTEATAS